MNVALAIADCKCGDGFDHKNIRKNTKITETF
jgi:hypothetical protein